MTPRLSRLAGTMPDRLVAQACGVSVSAARRYRHNNGIPTAGWHSDARALRERAVAWLADYPWGTAKALAAHLRVDARTARRIRAELGYEDAPDPWILWLGEQYGPVTADDVAEWSGVSVRAARSRLRRIGAVDVGRDDRNRVLWVAP